MNLITTHWSAYAPPPGLWAKVVMGGHKIWRLHNCWYGAVHLYPGKDGIYRSGLLCDLKVKKELRSQGHGTALVRRVVLQAIKLEMESITTIAENEGFWKAQEKYGWKEFENGNSDMKGQWMILDLKNHGY